MANEILFLKNDLLLATQELSDSKMNSDLVDELAL